MRKAFLLFLMTALFWASCLLSYAQNAVYLNARTINTKADFTTATNNRVTETELFNNKYYRLIQFKHLPLPSEKAELIQLGVDLVDYIPDNTFIVSLPKGLDLTILTKYDVKTMLILRGEDKMSDGIREGLFPDFAQTTVGKYDCIVELYANVLLEQAAIDLQKRGIEVVPNFRSISFKTLTIRLKKEDIGRVAVLPYIRFLDFVDAPPQREDEKSNQLHRNNQLNTNGATGLKYDGTGFSISFADDGSIEPHIDLQGRLIQVENFSSVAGDIDHADATAGTATAAGNLDPALKSGASGATVVSQIIDNYPHIQNAEANQSAYKAYVTSTSYGQGSPGTTEGGCNKYNSYANKIDNQAYTNTKLFHVFSTGNSGAGTCIGVANYGNITGGYKLAKNVITVGNVDINDRLINSSSRGPSIDGRIKPDICALGMNIYTIQPLNATTLMSGSSFSCPSVAAVATQLYHAYSDLNNNEIPDAALIKAVLLNSADDLGNRGPDFLYGWGRVNVWRSYLTLKEKRYIKSNISRTDSIKSIFLTVPAGVKQVKIMAYWHDTAAAPNASKALVNDLDLRVKNTQTGTILLPWVLNTSLNADSLAQKARRGDDHVNNMEQVVIEVHDLPDLGTSEFEIIVKGYNLPNDAQSFYLVYEFIKNEVTVTYPNGGEAIAVGTPDMIHWDAPLASDTTGSFNVDFSNDGGITWQLIAETVAGNRRAATWTPDQTTGKGCVRVRYVMNNGTIISDLSDTLFTASKLATNLKIKYVCPDSTYISFDTVTGAKSYEISRLGAKYMEMFKTANTNLVALPIKWQDSAWFSVRPILADGGIGRRVKAITKPRFLSNCPTTIDAQDEVPPLSIPTLTAFPNPSDNGLVTISLKNFDTESASLKVFDTLGKLVLTKQLGQIRGNKQEILNLKEQSKGVYLIQIETGKGVYSLLVIR